MEHQVFYVFLTSQQIGAIVETVVFVFLVLFGDDLGNLAAFVRKKLKPNTDRGQS